MKWMVSIGGLAGALGGCFAYEPGSFAHQRNAFSGTRTTVGCLDLAIDRRVDMGTSAVLGYQFGNRCDKPANVDLAYVNVIGRTGDGVEHKLVPYDPQSVLMAMKVDGRYAGGEALAYPSDEPLVEVCVDAASIAQRTPERWVCFARIDRDGAPFTEARAQANPDPQPPRVDEVIR
ncbi:MAG: hypothetical protein H6Q90_935 [Deltaproteobacteria bacterium]|nr:hypothetical protein [Deltaproteobacteria bacterium]